MRTVHGVFAIFLLVFLLGVSTPIGAGSGVHQFALLHPLFSHLHLINGRMVTHAEIQRGQVQQPPPSIVRSRGPAISAGSGVDAAEAGFGLSPTLPFTFVHLSLGQPWPAFVWDVSAPPGRIDAPPDPPPTSTA